MAALPRADPSGTHRKADDTLLKARLIGLGALM
jgi:hypothetical protein